MTKPSIPTQQRPQAPASDPTLPAGAVLPHWPAPVPRQAGRLVLGMLLASLLALPPSGWTQSLVPGGAVARPVEGGAEAVTLAARVRRLEENLGALDERLLRDRTARVALSGPSADRLALALLHLETVVASGRPWSREWQLIIALDGPALLPPLYLEVLGSHASRGLPSAKELGERFEALAPVIAARSASEADFLRRTMTALRTTLAGIGLVAPVEPGIVEATIASIREHLRRGELPGAMAEVATLEPEQQPLLAGWLAQLRARVAVEQALQEAILGLLMGDGRQG